MEAEYRRPLVGHVGNGGADLDLYRGARERALGLSFQTGPTDRGGSYEHVGYFVERTQRFNRGDYSVGKP